MLSVAVAETVVVRDRLAVVIPVVAPVEFVDEVVGLVDDVVRVEIGVLDAVDVTLSVVVEELVVEVGGSLVLVVVGLSVEVVDVVV